MDLIFKHLNNRDLAILTWIAFVLIASFSFKFLRKHVLDILKTLFSSTFIILFQILVCCTLLIIWALIEADFWDIKLLKSTLFWFFGVGIFVTFKAIGKDSLYFKNTIKNSIKLTIVIAFISNLHVFNYWLELISIPILAFTGIMLSYNDYKTKDKRVNTALNFIINSYSIAVLIFSFYKTIVNYKTDFTFESLQNLILPSMLTLSILPLAYLVSVFTAYEMLFARLYNVKNEKYSCFYIKFKIILRGHLNLSKIRNISLNLSPYYVNETRDINQYLRKIEKPVANKPQ
ncbi:MULTISPECIES: hypothetical protein [unclassified Carboxylicivirga]|uniref:hypothetical protein n=1 Tax=Carboxylicivirga TaxID=1628153 RepID=UPI003D32A689